MRLSHVSQSFAKRREGEIDTEDVGHMCFTTTREFYGVIENIAETFWHIWFCTHVAFHT
jgi:hypothetical protein